MYRFRRALSVVLAVLVALGVAVATSAVEGTPADAAFQRRTTTTLASSGSPSAAGATVTFTATVLRPGIFTPDPTSGTVTFYDGANVLGTGSVDGTHHATFATASLAPGSHSITATFGGTATFRASTSSVLTHTVNAPHSTTTSVASDLDPAQFTQSVTFTATVASATGTPEGSVAFKDGGTDIVGCDARPLSSGTATCTTNAFAIGAHTITGAYSGSPSHAASGSSDFLETVTELATETTLTADINPSTYGDLVTYTAVVAAPAGPAPADGTVTFRDGVDVIGSAPLDPSAVATITIGTLAAGTHSITAEFGGNPTHAGSTSDLLDQEVDKAGTVTSVTLAPNPSAFGDPVTFTATVSPDPGSGAVQFSIDGVDEGAPVPVGPGGSAVSAAVASLSVGDHTIAATFSGSANFDGSTGTLTQTVEKATTTTDLVTDSSPAGYGDTVTFTATVAAPTGTPTGTVTFQSDGTTIAGCDLQPMTTGVATCETDDLDAGSHTITADYSGSDSYESSSATPLDQVIAQAATTTELSVDTNPSVFGDSVTFTAAVMGLPYGEVPTGTVQFMIDGVAAGAPVPVAAGSASLVVNGLAAGDHEITADYSGSTNYEASSDSLTQTVDRAETSTVVESDMNPSVYGDAVTFTATVSPHPAAGTVQFTVDGDDLGGPVAVDAYGVAVSDALATLGSGDHEVVATFSGTANYQSSDSTLTQTVLRADTTTNVTSDENPSTYGDTVTFTVTVSPAPVSGSVQLSIDGAPVGGPVALTAGEASLVGTGLAPGVHQIEAEFLGTTNFKPSADVLAQTVVKVPSTTGLAITPGSPTAGAPLVLTATVTGSLVGSNPTGTVRFLVDGTQVGSPVTVSGTGIATMTMPAPPAGVHTRGPSTPVTRSTSPATRPRRRRYCPSRRAATGWSAWTVRCSRSGTSRTRAERTSAASSTSSPPARATVTGS